MSRVRNESEGAAVCGVLVMCVVVVQEKEHALFMWEAEHWLRVREWGRTHHTQAATCPFIHAAHLIHVYLISSEGTFGLTDLHVLLMPACVCRRGPATTASISVPGRSSSSETS